MITLKPRTKQDLLKILNQPQFKFIEERELVNDAEIRALVDKLKALLRSQKRIHVSIVERISVEALR